MHLLPSSLRGPLFMMLATGSYLVNDTFMKLATEGLSPYQVLFLRGVAAAVWGLPLLFMLGYGRKARQIFAPRVILRSSFELCAILAYVVALANMPIADSTALGQITPLLLLLGTAVLFGEHVGPARMILVAAGFLGALMVAQPTMQGISPYALLALANAVLCAFRELAGRRIPAEVPGMIVAMSAVILVLPGAGIAHLLTEEWAAPGVRHVLLLAAAGFFLIFGHFFIFMAYRVGPTATVAPFYYCFTVWAVISGFVVFGEVPNLLAACGMALVVSSGLAIVLLDTRKRKLAPVA